MIKVLKTTAKNIKDFNLKHWHEADIKHFGKDVDFKKKKVVLKADEDGEMIGTLTMIVEVDIATIDDIIVSTDKRNRGAGRQLMVKAEKIAKKLGCHKVRLVTGKGWAANKLYLSLGYEKVADIPNHYRHKDFIEYAKFI